MMVVLSLGMAFGTCEATSAQGAADISTPVRAAFTALSLLGTFALVLASLTGVLQVFELALVLMLSIPAGTFVYVVWRIDR